MYINTVYFSTQYEEELVDIKNENFLWKEMKTAQNNNFSRRH
jgi:hypothetical protein